MARICEICGKPVREGMTTADGDFYVHEKKCFPKFMDKIYGKHKWMQINDDGEGGYYIYSDDSLVGGYSGTGIFYTEWESDDDEEI